MNKDQENIKNSPESVKKETEDELIKRLEKEGAKKVQDTLKSNQPITANTFLDIINDGAKEFQEKMGRPMTYAEMREMYG